MLLFYIQPTRCHNVAHIYIQLTRCHNVAHIYIQPTRCHNIAHISICYFHRSFKNAAANVTPVAPTSVVFTAAILMLFVAVYYNVQRRDYLSWDYLIWEFKEQLRFCSQVVRARTCA
jgi:hypothetical protein